MFKCLVAKNDERTTNDERTNWLVRIFAIWLVRIPIDWSEFRTIGPNSERMTSCERRERVWRSEICQSVKCPKKLAWTDLDRVSFKKFVKESNIEIEKSAWTGLGKVKKGASSAASVFNVFLHDWSPGGRRSVLLYDGLTLTRGAVDATPFAAAFSLTFSLVKN